MPVKAAGGFALRAVPRAVGLVPRLVVRATPRRVRRPLLVLALLGGVLAAAYLLWIRDLGAFRVERVAVTGATSRDAAKLRAALTTAARGMTTLHVREDALRRVAAGHSAVAAIEVSADLPHALSIRVTEHRAVAVVADARGTRVPVAPDGTVLRTVKAAADLPVLAARPGRGGARIDSAGGREAVRIAATAPVALLGRVERVGRRPGTGLVAVLRDGPDLIFGDARSAGAKWAAAAAVLADPTTASATYVDLRLPARPAVGGLPAEAAPEDAEEPAEPGAAAPPETGTEAPSEPGAAPAQPVVPDPAGTPATPGGALSRPPSANPQQ